MYILFVEKCNSTVHADGFVFVADAGYVLTIKQQAFSASQPDHPQKSTN